jgi:hypothetical protein
VKFHVVASIGYTQQSSDERLGLSVLNGTDLSSAKLPRQVFLRTCAST